MANEYSATFAVTGLTTLKLRRFKAGGSLTWNGATWVAPNAGGFVFATDGIIAISEVTGLAGTYTNNGSLGSTVADDEFGYIYDTATNGVVPNGQIIQGGIVPTGSGGSGGSSGDGSIISQVTASAATGSIPFVNLVAKRTEAHQYIITVTDLDGVAVSFSGKTIKAVASLYDGTFAFQASATVSGTGSNVLTFTFSSTNLATSRKYKLDVWNTTDNSAAVEGILWVRPATPAQ